MSATSARSPSLLGDAVRGWDRFWFSRSDPATLAFIRLCCGLLVFYVHLTYSWDLFAYVGPEAWVDERTSAEVVRDTQQYAPPLDWSGDYWPIETKGLNKGNFFWSFYYHVTDKGWIVAVHVSFLVAMLLFAVGLWTRYTGLISWVGAMCYVQRANSTVFGLDTMMMIVLLYLLIGPSGARYSLDRWLEKWRARRRGEPEPEVEPSYAAHFAIRLIQVHFCIIYLASGTSKLLGSTWWGGTALNLILLNPSFAPLDWDPYYRVMRAVARHRWLWETMVSAGVLYTLVLEIGFPFLVWDRRWRWLMVCAAALLHTGIGMSMGLVTFSLMMLIMLLSFVPPEVIRALVDSGQEALGSLLSRRKPEPARRAGELVLTR